MHRTPNSKRPTLGPANADFDANQGHKELAKALCLSAYVQALEGKGADAVTDIALARRLGSRFAGGDLPIVPYMVGISIEGVADDAALRIAAMKTIGARDLAALRRVVEAKPDPNRVTNALRVEFDAYVIVMAAAVPNDPRRPLLPSSWAPALSGQTLFNRQDTARRLAQPFLTAIGNRNRPWANQVSVEAVSEREAPNPPVGEAKLTADEVRRLREWLGRHPNYLGRQLARSSASYAARVEELERKTLARQRLTAAAIGMERYRRVYGKRAGTLQAALGTLIPADPFRDRPVRYDAKVGRLWSVGPDGRDDGGKATRIGRPNPDIVVAVPAP
jgi:hypothetical protein